MKRLGSFANFLIFAIVILLASCDNNSSNSTTKLKDYDGNTYNIKKFESQLWIVENLNASHFQNGDTIHQFESFEEWVKASKEEKPGWSYFNFDSKYSEKFGKLYNWYAVNDKRGLAPKGWHIPNMKEWGQLIKYLGGYTSQPTMLNGTVACESLKDSTVFNGLLGGVLLVDVDTEADKGGSKFYGLNQKTLYWTSTDYDGYNVGYISLMTDCNERVQYMPTALLSGATGKFHGVYVRCIKDVSE